MWKQTLSTNEWHSHGHPVHCACHCSYHEETQPLHMCQSPKPIMCMHLIDDAFVIMCHVNNNCCKFHTKMNQFKTSQGIRLEWEAKWSAKTVECQQHNGNQNTPKTNEFTSVLTANIKSTISHM